MGLWLFFHLIFFITSYWSLVSTFEGKADVKYNEEFPWNWYKKNILILSRNRTGRIILPVVI